MTPTNFEFSVSMPADPQLLGVVRQLATQAVVYAELPVEDGAALADQAAGIIDEHVSLERSNGTPIEILFRGGAQAVEIELSWVGRDGARQHHSCRIAHPSAA